MIDMQDTSRADADHVAAMDAETRQWMQRALLAEEASRKLTARLAELGACPECGGDGVRDSGGVYPWGEAAWMTCTCCSGSGRTQPLTARGVIARAVKDGAA